MKKNAIAEKVETVNAETAVKPKAVENPMDKIKQVTPELLIQTVPIKGDVDHARLVSVITRINSELLTCGAIFTDDGFIEGLNRQQFATVVNPIVLDEFQAELAGELKAALRAEGSPIRVHADWLGGDELETFLDHIADKAIKGNVGFIEDDGELENLILSELAKIKAPQEDPVKDAELKAFIAANTKPLEPLNPKPEKVVVEVEAASEPVVEVSVTKPTNLSTQEFNVGIDANNACEVKIKAVDSDGKEVKVSRVEIVSSRLPYKPTFTHSQATDGEWFAASSPIPSVGKLTAEEIKEIVAKTIVEFRDNFNGKQCEWNTSLVFPDPDVNLLGMFTDEELNRLVWGFSEPDLSCWDIQSVIARPYGLEFTYENMVA